MDPRTHTPDAHRARWEFRLLLALNLVLVAGVAYVVFDYLQSPDVAARVARLTRGGPMWTGLLAGSLVVGWVDVLVAPMLALRRELHPPPVRLTRRAA